MNTRETILRRLDEMFPQKNLLSAADITRYTGLSIHTTLKMFGLSRGTWIDKAVLADKLCENISSKEENA